MAVKGLGRKAAQRGLLAITISLGVLLAPITAPAQQLQETRLPVNGSISQDGGTVRLAWRGAPSGKVETVGIWRRPYGATGAASWKPLQTLNGTVLTATDATVQRGAAYEYRIIRRDSDGAAVDYGYWLAGRSVPYDDRPKTVHLVYDESLLDDLRPYLARFASDLIGDGWRVQRYAMPRHVPRNQMVNLRAVANVKGQLISQYQRAPDHSHAIVLIGHVPIVESGRAAPDGHGARAQFTDLIYADVDGRWSVSPEGDLLDSRVPSDTIEMQVGRIDFWSISEGDRSKEVAWLKAYFDKNHNWRHGRLGDLRQAYGRGRGLISEIYGLHNVVGPTETKEGGHHDLGETQPWLWGVEFGNAGGHTYAERFRNKAVFAINFGSHKQRFGQPRNAMVALLAQPWFTLAVGWGARPAWWPHHMALGGSIGLVHLRTVNNGRSAEPYATSMEYLPTGTYLWQNPVWVNLMGDPTLRAFPLTPPRQLSVTPSDTGYQLTWQASVGEDVTGYSISRVQQDGTLAVIGTTTDRHATTFTDTEDASTGHYVVRSVGEKQVHAGSFMTRSQGVFAGPDTVPLQAPALHVVVKAGETVDLPQSPDAQIMGFVTGPDAGDLTRTANGWTYTAPADFEGEIRLNYVVSNASQSRMGDVAITVED